ncbi:hypothetical protein QDT03_07080 [Acinetobacter baumannii]|nr:hypothetical protein [Acinetobacter baumannii]MDH2606357.1 hypothetical protein [Acinetobacter baumannii]MDO7422534.1 hypothetical protein [Acinetobacter baumannii]
MKYLKGFAICTIVILILWCFKFYDQQLPKQPKQPKQDNIELYD